MLFKVILTIAAVASYHAASASESPFAPIDSDYCESGTSACPTNGHCVLVPPCHMGVMCDCDDGYEVYDVTVLGVRTVQCVKATAKVGESCDYATKVFCLGTHTYCGIVNLNVQCVCLPGHTANSDNSDCTPPATVPLGSNCTGVALTCGYGAICKNTVCHCAPGYTKFNSTDCTHYDEGETCDSSADCDLDTCHFGSCDEGKFECIKGMRWHKWDVDANLIDGYCLPWDVRIVGTGEFCQNENYPSRENPLTADELCARGLRCGMCPETPGLTRCIGVQIGNGSTAQRMSFTAALLSVIISLAVLLK